MFKDEMYGRLVTSFKEFKQQIDKMKAEKIYDKHYIESKVQEFRGTINKDLNNFYDEKVISLRKKQEEVKEKYSSVKYEDPTAELLRRQDIERKIKLMDKDSMAAHIKELRQGETEGKDAFYFDTLQLELKSRGLEQDFAAVSGIRNAYDIDTPWNKDDEFIKAAEEILSVNQVRKSNLLWEGEGNEKQIHNLNEL